MKTVFRLSLIFNVIAVPFFAYKVVTTPRWKDVRIFLGRHLGNDQVVFFGDSLTLGCHWQELMPNHKTLNLAMSGAQFRDMKKSVTRFMPIPYAKRILLMGGINNIVQRSTPQQTISEFRQVLSELLKQNDKNKILVQSILPVRYENLIYRVTNEDIQKINSEIKKVSLEMGVKYVDLYPLFLDSQNELDGRFTNDGVHITTPGCEHWKTQIIDTIDGV